MTPHYKKIWQAILTISMALLLGVGVFTWMTQQLPVPEQQVQTTTYDDDHRLVKLEQAVLALTQVVQNNQTKTAQAEAKQVTTPANSEVSRIDLAQVIREEALTEANILNSPENKAAFQSASSVVQTAVAAKRWTEEDRETFRGAFGQLTNNQRMELMNILAPAINNGDVQVEVMGPLF